MEMVNVKNKIFVYIILSAVIWCVASSAQAKVDLVTLPTRDTVQLTIYNSADLTLARESRLLTLKEGMNELQFSWANTLIDPTSLAMLPKADAKNIDIFDLTFPPRVKNLGLWNIKSAKSAKVLVEISYLTSGLSWRAFYLGTLSKDEKEMRLKGYVRVTNNSGEDYENAQVRMIVGKVHLVDEIAALAQREYPYGRPGYYVTRGDELEHGAYSRRGLKDVAFNMVLEAEVWDEKKEIIKEGLSEYFLYTIEGTETIPHGWSKRLPSFDALKVPVVNLYKYEEERYGSAVMRFLSFKNDEKHDLGDTPIPGGVIKVFREVDNAKHLSYEGQSSFKYIPVEEDVELNLGGVNNIIVKPTLMKFKTEKYRFNRKGNISGWNEVRDFKVEVKNTRDVPIKVEILRNVHVQKWAVSNSGDHGQYEKVDADTVKYTLALNPRENKEFTYRLTTFHGRNADRK